MTQRLTETERRLQERLDALQRAEHQRLERASSTRPVARPPA